MRSQWLLGVLSTLLLGAGPAPAVELGAKLPGGTALRDLRGSRRALHDFKNNKAVVLVFLGTDCPLSNLSLPRLLELEKKYRDKAVQFLAVYPNEKEDLEHLAVHSYDRDVPFPVLKDAGQKLADQAGVTRVPSVAV